MATVNTVKIQDNLTPRERELKPLKQSVASLIKKFDKKASENRELSNKLGAMSRELSRMLTRLN